MVTISKFDVPQIFKNYLRISFNKMPYLKTYRLFISHAWSVNEEYNRLVELLESIQTFKVKIDSLPEYKPSIDPESSIGLQKLKGLLEYQIRSVNCAFILPSMFVSDEAWVKESILFCQIFGVTPLAMALPNGEELPAELSIKAAAIIDWNAESLEDGVKAFSTTRFGAT
jgi:hypothetical protein